MRRTIRFATAVGVVWSMVLMTMVVPADADSSERSVSGRPVPELEFVDDMVNAFMDEWDDDSYGVGGGVVGIMHEGDIVYLRGFGSNGHFVPSSDGDSTDGQGDSVAPVPMPENALVRIASVTKAVTSAATRHLVAEDPSMELASYAFDLGQEGGGLLDVDPFGGLGDDRLEDVTVWHLLRHLGGWDRDAAGDHTYSECEIADDYGVDSPPGRERTMNWIMGQPLQYTPGSPSGTDTRYSNIGTLAAGMIVESHSGTDLMRYVRSNILTPSMWVPSTEIELGRSLVEDANPREPFYANPFKGSDVFKDCDEPVEVNSAYGSYHHEARVGQGGMIASAPSLLKLAERYQIGRGTNWATGKSRDDEELNGSQNHGGDLFGHHASLYQTKDDINVFAFFNNSYDKDKDDGSQHFGSGAIRGLIVDILDEVDKEVTTWPTATSDGFWVEPHTSEGGGAFAHGGFHAPINGIGEAVSMLADGSKVRLKPGSHDWTGTVDTKMLIDAPLGTARIGD